MLPTCARMTNTYFTTKPAPHSLPAHFSGNAFAFYCPHDCLMPLGTTTVSHWHWSNSGGPGLGSAAGTAGCSAGVVCIKWTVTNMQTHCNMQRHADLVIISRMRDQQDVIHMLPYIGNVLQTHAHVGNMCSTNVWPWRKTTFVNTNLLHTCYHMLATCYQHIYMLITCFQQKLDFWDKTTFYNTHLCTSVTHMFQTCC